VVAFAEASPPKRKFKKRRKDLAPTLLNNVDSNMMASGKTKTESRPRDQFLVPKPDFLTTSPFTRQIP
jgi:hypothetical protein